MLVENLISLGISSWCVILNSVILWKVKQEIKLRYILVNCHSSVGLVSTVVFPSEIANPTHHSLVSLPIEEFLMPSQHCESFS